MAPQQELNEISFTSIVAVLFKQKTLIVAVTSVFAIISIFYALSLENIYRSETKLIAASNGSKDLSSLAGGLGGLASLAGVNIGNESNDKVIIALELLKSRAFLTNFVEKRDILIPLIAAEGVEDSGELKINEKLFDIKTEKWIRKVIAPKPVIPSSEDIYSAFQDYLSIEQDKKSGVTTIYLACYSPKIAQQWLSWLVEDINEVIKLQDIEEAQASIKYLQSLIVNTDNHSMKDTFYKLIEEQTKTLMLSNVRDDYVFRTIDPATFPEVKASPKRALICILVTLFGAVFIIMFVLVRQFSLKKTQ